MRIAVYSTKPYDRRFLEAANEGRHELRFLEARLSEHTISAASRASASSSDAPAERRSRPTARTARSTSRITSPGISNFHFVRTQTVYAQPTDLAMYFAPEPGWPVVPLRVSGR